jgi:voltage-gated potassium channel
MENQKPSHRLYTPAASLFHDVLVRLLIIVITIGASSVFLWFDRDGLYDVSGKQIGFWDIVYFIIVTIATVGYGDIIPVTDIARAHAAFIITVTRTVVGIVFISTAYQLILKERWENWKIKELGRRLKRHTIICGFGVTGTSAAQELVRRGVPKDQIIVIDQDEKVLLHAMHQGFTALAGDATKEKMLLDARIKDAENVIISVGNDSISALSCLTVRDLNPDANIIATCRERENIRLLYRSGAKVVIAPEVTGGCLAAVAIESPIAANFLEDFLHYGRGVELVDHVVTKEEAGLTIAELESIKKDDLVLGIKAERGHTPFNLLRDYKMKEGDTIVLVVSNHREEYT